MYFIEMERFAVELLFISMLFACILHCYGVRVLSLGVEHLIYILVALMPLQFRFTISICTMVLVANQKTLLHFIVQRIFNSG